MSVPSRSSLDPAGHAAFDGLLPALVEELPSVLDDVVAGLAEEHREYAEFLLAERDEVAAVGQIALRRVVLHAAAAGSVDRAGVRGEDVDELGLFDDIGRAAWRSGERLADLLTAYRSGARVAWRVISTTAVRRGLPADGIALLAEAVFVLVDELSSLSAHGYLQEQSTAVAERDRAREELPALLLSGSDPGLLQSTAARAQWPLPGTAAVVLVDPDDPVARELLVRCDPACLPVRRPDAVGVLLPDPDAPGRRAQLLQRLRRTGAVVGPPVTLDRLPSALRITQVALRLRKQGTVSGDPVLVEDHLDAVLVHQDSELLAVLTERVLAPLADLPADTRERLEETLLAWLEQMGDRQRMAAELYVHRQTVRYRLAQLSELFGDRLDSPAFRRQLLLALGWRRGAVTDMEIRLP